MSLLLEQHWNCPDSAGSEACAQSEPVPDARVADALTGGGARGAAARGVCHALSRAIRCLDLPLGAIGVSEQPDDYCVRACLDRETTSF